jgi:DNA-binding FadR family transcriptional regulator
MARSTNRVPLRVPKTAELVAGHIRQAIVRGELTADEALPTETELMGQYSVSRPTLRESFRILESEGLITVRRGARGGARVQVPTTEMAARYAGFVLQHRGATLTDVLHARVIIEAPAAGIVAGRSDRKRCARALTDWRQGTGQPGSPAYTLAFHCFNRLLVSLTENDTLILVTAMLESISDAAAERFAAQPAEVDSRLVRRTERSRDRLIELIAAGESEAAEALWRAHLTEAGQLLAGDQGARVVDLLR